MRALTSGQFNTLACIAETGSAYVSRQKAEALSRRGLITIRDLSPCGRRWTARLTAAGQAILKQRKRELR
jgi:hypothetical protein